MTSVSPGAQVSTTAQSFVLPLPDPRPASAPPRTADPPPPRSVVPFGASPEPSACGNLAGNTHEVRPHAQAGKTAPLSPNVQLWATADAIRNGRPTSRPFAGDLFHRASSPAARAPPESLTHRCSNRPMDDQLCRHLRRSTVRRRIDCERPGVPVSPWRIRVVLTQLPRTRSPRPRHSASICRPHSR